MEEQQSVVTILWSKISELEEKLIKERNITVQLKRANSKQKNTIRRIVKDRDRLLKELNPNKQNYVNVQKGVKKRR